jgi:hypothetical protein
MVVVWFLSIAALVPGPPVGSTSQDVDHDSWGMVVVADLFCWPFLSVPCADADRDGRREFYASICIGPDIWDQCAVEHIGSNQFDSTVIAMPEWSGPEGIGDADRDGLPELVLHCPTSLLVYESPDSFSLPTDSVWGASLWQSEAFSPAVVDIDADSAREIAIWGGGHGILLYECTGDNQYVQRHPIPNPGRVVPVQCPDMDCDGRRELAAGQGGGVVSFYEAVGNDSVAFRDTVRLLSTARNTWCQAVASAPDMDRDGRSELLATCVSDDLGLFVLTVIEAPSDDSFRIVWADTTRGSQGSSIAVGDIHGDSTPEFAVASGGYVQLYRCIGNDRYERFWQSDSGGERARLYDINSDGRDELICDYRDRTLIWAWQPVGVEERAEAALRRVSVLPSVARRYEVVRVTGLPQSAECEVVDASGRIVASPATGNWSTGTCPPGTYFLRIRLGNQAVVRKVLVVE